MSIDTVKALALSGAPTGHKRTTGVNDLHREIFEKLLEDASNKPESLQEKSRQLIASARLSQLQMLQNIFADEEEQTADELFPGDLFGGDMSLLASRQGQIIDKYYSSPQAASHSAGQLGKDDIDRLIDRVATSLSLAPGLIRSVVTAESGYQADAVSPVGAQGLMQLMPDTAKELGVRDSFNAHENLLGGSRYLKQLLDKYAGDLDHALAAYNWGQGNVDRHGLDNMPQETRNYVAKIKSLLNKEAV